MVRIIQAERVEVTLIKPWRPLPSIPSGLAILAELVLHQVVRRIHADRCEAVGRSSNVTTPFTLRCELVSMASMSGMTGSRYWLSCRNMPYQLATCSFQYCATCSACIFPRTVRTDNQHRSRRLETDTALDTDDGVAHMAVAADGVGSTYLFYLLYGLDLIVILHAVHATNLPFLKPSFQQLRPRLRGMFQIAPQAIPDCCPESRRHKSTCPRYLRCRNTSTS